MERHTPPRTVERVADPDSLVPPDSSGPDVGLDRLQDSASLSRSGINSLVFASPEELMEEESVGFWMPLEEEIAVGRRNIERWRDLLRTPSSGLFGHSRRASATLEEGRDSLAVSRNGTGATSLRSKPSGRRKVFGAPSLRSFSSYWARSEGTNIEAYRRQSYAPSVLTAQTQEDVAEKFPMPPVPRIPDRHHPQSPTESQSMLQINSPTRHIYTPSAAGVSLNPFGSEAGGSSLNAMDGHSFTQATLGRQTLGRTSGGAPPSAWGPGPESVDGDWNGEEWVAAPSRQVRYSTSDQGGGHESVTGSASGHRVSSLQVRDLGATRHVQIHPSAIPELSSDGGPRQRQPRGSSIPGFASENLSNSELSDS